MKKICPFIFTLSSFECFVEIIQKLWRNHRPQLRYCTCTSSMQCFTISTCSSWYLILFVSVEIKTRLLAVPFLYSRQGLQNIQTKKPKTQSAARLEWGEKNKKRLGGGGGRPLLVHSRLFSWTISHALLTIQKGTASSPNQAFIEPFFSHPWPVTWL